MVNHRNLSAHVKARILLLKDSYGLPIQAFLSTLFSEVDVLDLRRFDEILEKYEIDTFVVGMPVNMNGTLGERVEITNKFINNFCIIK